MRFLLDENLDAVTAKAVDVVAQLTADEFRYIEEFTPAGTQDDDIPAICRENGCHVLVTVNYKDFGAKKVYYQALLDEGVSVVVLRPGKNYKMTVPHQISMLTLHYAQIRKLLDSDEHCLVKVTLTTVVRRSLDDLLNEIGGDEKKLP